MRPTQQGSCACRPAKRKALTGLETLRAIPWIFAWTQTRFHLPVWLGIGEAFKVTAGSFAPSSACHKVCRPLQPKLGLLYLRLLLAQGGALRGVPWHPSSCRTMPVLESPRLHQNTVVQHSAPLW